MARGNWKTGARAGYSNWRYGEQRTSKVKMPILGAGKREHVIGATAKLLGGWSFSPYQHEASCRHGLRSALCLEGNGWDASDQEAASIVAGALLVIGARRPTWEQGQREYVIPAENCNWCGAELDADHLRARFCSPECGKMAYEHRNYERTAKDDAVRLAAYAMVRKGKTAARSCLHCGDRFHPLKANSPQKFCSRKCQHDFKAVTPAHPRVCSCCGSTYLARANRGRFCSTICRNVKISQERGSAVVLLPDRFDHFIAAPIDARPAWLTAERFDAMVA